MPKLSQSAKDAHRRAILGGALKSGCALIASAIAGGWKSAPASAQSEAPSNSVLHVAMNVADMERTTRFYTEVFGFKASPPHPDAPRRHSIHRNRRVIFQRRYCGHCKCAERPARRTGHSKYWP